MVEQGAQPRVDQGVEIPLEASPSVLAALSLAIVPVLLLYLIFSKQLIRGITSGAVK